MIPAMFSAECPRDYCPLNLEGNRSLESSEFSVRQDEAGQEEILPPDELRPLSRISEEWIENAFLCRETSVLSDRDPNISAPMQPSWIDEASVLNGFEHGVSAPPQPLFPEASMVRRSEGAASANDAIVYVSPIGAEALGATEINVDALECNLMLCESDANLPLCERRMVKSLTHWYEDAFDDASTNAATPQEDSSDASSVSSHSDFISRDPVRSTLAETGDAFKSLHPTGIASMRTEVFFLVDPSALEESFVEELI